MKINFSKYINKEQFILTIVPTIAIVYENSDCDSIKTNFIIEFSWLVFSLFIIIQK